MHFSEDPQRFYAYSPRLGLSSWKLDGSDQQTHLRVMGLANPAGYPAMASDILLSPNGQHAVAAVASQLYLVDMSAVPAEQAPINVYAAPASEDHTYQDNAFEQNYHAGQ